MYMVFEDRLVVSEVNQQYVGVSHLISEAYALSGVRVIFTGSNVGMKAKLKELSSCIEDGELVYERAGNEKASQRGRIALFCDIRRK